MALKFDGTGDLITYGDNHDFTPASTFTIEYWYKSSNAGVSMRHVSKEDSNNNGEGWSCLNTTANLPAFDFFNTTGAGFRRTGSTNINDGAWHHIAFTYDGSGDATGCHIYVDGIQETESGSGTITGTTTTAELLQLSGREAASGLLTGELADIRIWSDVRTLQEIQAYRFRRIAFNEPGLVYYVQGNDNSVAIGSTVNSAIDYVGALTATIAGNPTFSDHPPISQF